VAGPPGDNSEQAGDCDLDLDLDRDLDLDLVLDLDEQEVEAADWLRLGRPQSASRSSCSSLARLVVELELEPEVELGLERFVAGAPWELRDRAGEGGAELRVDSAESEPASASMVKGSGRLAAWLAPPPPPASESPLLGRKSTAGRRLWFALCSPGARDGFGVAWMVGQWRVCVGQFGVWGACKRA